MKQIPLMQQRVTDSSQAVIYLFSRLRSNRRIPCVQCERATPCLPPCIVEGCQQGKNRVALINVAIKFGDEHFYFGIYFPNIFFVKTFFEHVFSKYFSKIFFSKFLFQLFFKISFLRASLSMPPRLQRQNGLCVSVFYMKNMIYSKRSKFDFSLV